MNQNDYALRWTELNDEREALMDKRTTLETELSEITIQIEHIKSVLNHLAPLAGVPVGEEISDLGITDAIRYILSHSNVAMSAMDVRDALSKKRFDLSGHSAPMSSIYKVLSRLAEDDSSSVDREKGEGGRVFYFDKNNVGITDEDIPF